MKAELKARVEEANEFITALTNGNGNMTEPNYSRLQRLMNDLSTALQDSEARLREAVEAMCFEYTTSTTRCKIPDGFVLVDMEHIDKLNDTLAKIKEMEGG